MFSLIGFLLYANPFVIFAETKPSLSNECLKEMKNRDEQMNQKVVDDLVKSFRLPVKEEHYYAMKFEDIDAAYLLYGGRLGDPYYKSIVHLFDQTGPTIGKPVLFIQPQLAYFLYKKPDHSNVMMSLKLNEDQWEVVEEKITAGKEIKYIKVKCEKDYINQKKKYYNK